MNAIELKQKLNKNERIYMTLVLSHTPVLASKLISCGIDAVFIDSEHCANDRVNVSWATHNYQNSNLSTFVRTSSHDIQEIARTLDGGANGILVPYVETCEQALKFVGAVKYRPLKGDKLEKVLRNEISLSKEETDYLSNFNKNNYLFINIESTKGVENLEEIVQLEGVDAIIVGPHDLSVSMGIAEQYTHPDFDKAINQIIKTCRKYNKSVGVHSAHLELQKKYCEYGMNIVLYSNDFEIYSRNLLSELNEIRLCNNEAIYSKSGEIII